jgi:hypothetical protein
VGAVVLGTVALGRFRAVRAARRINQPVSGSSVTIVESAQ